ncbi:hypothetical protein [Notoacmeibacter ruber]|uniref:Chemotaxis protein MotC n=1 Tax=Notoacmeibacter ruber TaxID=2670375 RepID=A0A3L7JDS8_9HYPH|nr:hypothetical protein [Notoacmeibacter ruber]RLQ88836.1 hypothetical protein D8780_12015 [Notoacmeibacter ruber]
MTRYALRKASLACLAASFWVAAPASAVQDSSIRSALFSNTGEAAVRATPKQARLPAPVQLASSEPMVEALSQPLPPKLPESEQPVQVAPEETETPTTPQSEAPAAMTKEESDAKLQFDAFIMGLFEFQDAIIDGDPSALALQGKVLRRLQLNLMSARALFSKPDAPVEPLLVFALSGGDARISADLLRQVPPSHSSHEIVQAIINYLKGSPDSAKGLARQDPTAFSFPLSALVALSTGTANARGDKKVARNSLEMAAILGTGTLVEEVALRRLLDIHAEEDNEKGFFDIAESYGLRYSKSIFLSEFARRLTVTLTEHDWVPPRGLDPILEGMLPAQSSVVARQIARGAAIRGNHELALMSVEWLRRFNPSQANDQLYEAMAELAAREIDKAETVETEIVEAELSKNDRLLLSSLRRALAHIRGAEQVADITGAALSDLAAEPVLKAELTADHKANLPQRSDADAPSIPVAVEIPETSEDTKLASLRERLSVTLDAIEELSAK